MLSQQSFGSMPDGTPVEQFSLSNAAGVTIDILNLGGIIRRWQLPTAGNTPLDIVLGFDNLADYLADDSYLGAIIGRYANRIKAGQFSLGSKEYQTNTNLARHCLHGGIDGFSHRVWQATVLAEGDNPSLQLSLLSEDGDQGFGGNLAVKVIYSLTEQNKLRIEYFASCDQDTIFNPTNHSYFNLDGHDSGSVAEHQMQIFASHYTPTDTTAIPTGELAKVAGTDLDFRSLAKVSRALNSAHPQIQNAGGLDLNFCLDDFATHQQEAKYCAQALSANQKVQLKVFTSMPGLQVFSANHFVDKKAKDHGLYQAFGGLCFETQFYPDSPNQAHFPSTRLAAKEAFYSVTEYQVIF